MIIDREDRAVFTEQLRQRRRGRPRSATPMIPVSVRIPVSVFDELCRRAYEERASVPALMRAALVADLQARRN